MWILLVASCMSLEGKIQCAANSRFTVYPTELSCLMTGEMFATALRKREKELNAISLWQHIECYTLGELT